MLVGEAEKESNLLKKRTTAGVFPPFKTNKNLRLFELHLKILGNL
jgi:hypothetical protein